MDNILNIPDETFTDNSNTSISVTTKITELDIQSGDVGGEVSINIPF